MDLRRFSGVESLTFSRLADISLTISECKNRKQFISNHLRFIRAADLIQLRWHNVTASGRLHYQMGKNHKERDLLLVALINKYLKKIAEKAEIDKPLSMHISRHSFAHIAQKSGTESSAIKNILGHSNLATTERYMGSFDTAKTDETLRNVFAKKKTSVADDSNKSKEEQAIELLKGLSPEQILQEQDPDFSARICSGLSIEDLSEDAVQKMRERLYAKRGKDEFLNKPINQLLSDLQLSTEDGLNYAALILLGKPEAIRKYLPQNNVVVEYRVSENQLRYSARQEFCEPLFTGIDKIWAYLNQPATNPLIHVNAFPQVLDAPSYTEETVREGILNSIQHRNFQMGGDILVRIFPESLVISNTGGFPYGVNIGNILTVNSAPRSRRLAEVIEKAGLIERSGQGVDIMYANCISEGRNLPDYSSSDDFQVILRIESAIINTHLRKFITYYQADKESQERNVFDLLTIYSIVRREGTYINERSIAHLTKEGIVINHPKYGYIMGDIYFEKYSLVENGSVDSNTCRRLFYLFEDGPKSMSSFQQEWEVELTQKQIRTKIEGLVGKVLSKTGKNRGTTYCLVNIS